MAWDKCLKSVGLTITHYSQMAAYISSSTIFNFTSIVPITLSENQTILTNLNLRPSTTAVGNITSMLTSTIGVPLGIAPKATFLEWLQTGVGVICAIVGVFFVLYLGYAIYKNIFGKYDHRKL